MKSIKVHYNKLFFFYLNSLLSYFSLLNSIVGLLFLGSQISKVSASKFYIFLIIYLIWNYLFINFLKKIPTKIACTITVEGSSCNGGCTDSDEYGYRFVEKTDSSKVVVQVTGGSACNIATLTGGQTLVVNDISSHAIANVDNTGSETTTVESGSYIVLNNNNEIINDLVKGRIY